MRKHEGNFLVHCGDRYLLCLCDMDFTVYSMTDLEVKLSNRRIDCAMFARQNVKSNWGMLYWDNVLACLLRQANRLH